MSSGCFLALGLVVFVCLMAECRSGRIEAHGYMCGLLLVKHLVECVHESEYGGCVEPLDVIRGERIIA